MYSNLHKYLFASRKYGTKTANMGLRETSEHMSYYATLKPDEKARMYPCRKAKCVMTSSDSIPSIHASMTPLSLDVLDEAPRPGTIPAATPLAVKPLNAELGPEVIEEEVTITKKTLPTPEPRPKIARNGLDLDLDGKDRAKRKSEKRKDEDDSCLVNCIYVAQQCCECTIS